MIDTGNENLIRLNDVPKLKWLPTRRGGSRLNISTVYRWAMAGLRGHRLETVKVGGVTCTSEEALLRFFNALSEPAANTIPARTPARREREIAAAEARLEAAGV